MTTSITFLPQPRHVEWGGGAYPLGAQARLRVDRRAWERLQTALEELAAEWRAHGVALTCEPWAPAGEREPLRLSIGAHGEAIALAANSPEAYALDVRPTGLAIVASDAHGLFNGLQTLRQLAAQSDGSLPCGTIRDWPALALRGIHLDLKGGMAPVSYWQEAIRLLAGMKINAVLIEYEDKFPFTSHPDIVGPGAFTRAELDALLATARDHFVEVIPLLQCLGHVEYILRHPAYAALRESGDLTQFCPEHPGSLPLYYELADEMLAAHPGCRNFHLGADEAWLLGDCPRCRAAVAARGKLDLYLRHVNQAAARVRAHGARPIIWDDMIQRNLESNSLAALPQDIVLCDWFYSQRSPRAVSFYYGGSEGHTRTVWASRRWLQRDPGMLMGEVRWLEDAPDNVQAFAREYWDRGEYPDYGSSLPWVRFFVRQGRTVIGASCAKGAEGFSVFSPLYAVRLDNVATWARTAKEDGAEGVIATAWSRYNGLTVPCEPFEMGWHAYAASAAYDWEQRDPDRAALDRQFAACFLGAPDSPALPAVDWLDRGKQLGHPYLLAAARGAFESAGAATTPHGRRYLAHLALAAQLAQATAPIERGLQSAWAQAARAEAGLLTRSQKQRALEACEAGLRGLAAWREAARRILAMGLNPVDVQEAIETQCYGYERRIELLRTHLQAAVPLDGAPMDL